MKPERCSAIEVQVGDKVARARTHPFNEVAEVPRRPGGYIVFVNGARIRPRASAPLWRIPAP